MNCSNNIDDSWITATSTYNYMMKDPLLDWLKYHYKSLSQKNRKYKNNELYNNSYNFTPYIMEQGILFEKKVMKLITKKFNSERIKEIHGELDPRNPEKVKETLDAMKKGIPIIHSGVLHNHKNKTYGIPDLLVRSDWLKFLVNDNPIDIKDENKPALKLHTNEIKCEWHYRVVDIKFTGLLLRADATHILNSGSFPAYKSQLLIYNWALGDLQGYTPDQVYILGRKWKYVAKGETFMGNNCFDKLGIINYKTIDRKYIDETKKAIKWLGEVRSKRASNWNILKYPLSRWELYPNMCNNHDYPWHNIKNKIAKQGKELTSLWMVGPKNRNLALKSGISQWTNKLCSPELLGIKGKKTGNTLKKIISINRNKNTKISPKYINNNIGGWKECNTIEFFVDFETCNGAVSNIKGLPFSNNDTILFMIGVGYVDPATNIWIYKDFTVNRLNFSEELRICTEFINFIKEKLENYGNIITKCIHWASAENNIWNDVVERHNPILDSWKLYWVWLDLLNVFKEEPIVIKGCMSFGLKDVASSMKNHGFISTSWNMNSSCIDGQSAMIAARKSHNISIKKKINMSQIPIMNEIIKYNEVDVRVLYEIIHYLRQYHISPLNKKRSHNFDNNEIPSKRLKLIQSEEEEQNLSILTEMNDEKNNLSIIISPRYNFRKRNDLS